MNTAPSMSASAGVSLSPGYYASLAATEAWRTRRLAQRCASRGRDFAAWNAYDAAACARWAATQAERARHAAIELRRG